MVSAYENARANNARYLESLRDSNDRRAKRKAAEEEAKRKAELQAQQIAAQERRDKQQQKYGQADTAQRAYYAANVAADDFNRTKQLNRQQQKDVRRRDTLNNDFTLTRDREQARDQQDQDNRRFGLSTKENEQKFGYQMMENDQQFGHQIQRDRFQHGNTLERDGRQFGYDSIRAQQQHGNTLERDQFQNQFSTEQDTRRNQFDVARDAQQQKYTQQNQYQRETAEISARWQETIQQARNAGMDFSERQKQEMKELDAVFRKTVMTNDDLDEGLKQQAMLLHQKKLSAIVPEEKIANPKEGLESSLMFHEQTGTWFMQGRDSKGFPTYEPIGMQSDGMAEQQKMQQLQQKEMQAQQEKERQLAEKTNERRIEAERKRMEDFGQTVNDLMTELDPVTDSPLYPTRSDALEAAKDRFAQTEEFYRKNYGLDPHPIYKDDRLDGTPVPFRPTTDPQKPPLADQYRQRLQERQGQQQPQQPQQLGQHVPGMADSARLRNGDPMPKPIAMSSTNIDSHMQKTMAGGDKEAAAALQTVKLISAKNNGGPPPAGSQDLADLVKAIKYLQSKGISIQGEAGKPQNTTPSYSGNQILMDAGWR
jgi:hypothetical protein